MLDFEHVSIYLPRPFRIENEEHREIFIVLFALLRENQDIMADISNLSADLNTLAQSVVSAKDALDELAQKVADLSAGGVSQEDIDALDAQVKAASDALDGAVKQDSSDGSVAVGPVTQAGTPAPSFGDLESAPTNAEIAAAASDAPELDSGEANDAAPDQDVVTAPATDSAPASSDESSSETTEAATESAPEPEETPLVDEGGSAS